MQVLEFAPDPWNARPYNRGVILQCDLSSFWPPLRHKSYYFILSRDVSMHHKTFRFSETDVEIEVSVVLEMFDPENSCQLQNEFQRS